MDNLELSEINFGLILANRNPASLYMPEWFHTPYDTGVEILMKKGATKEDVAKVLSKEYLDNAHKSVQKMNGLGEELDWPSALKDSYYSKEVGRKLQKTGKKMENNEPVDLLSVYGELGAALAKESGGLTLLQDIDYTGFTPMIDSGWDIIDNIVGGIPKHGLIVVVGETKVGKSFFLGKLTGKFLKQHPEKRGGIFTLEMPGEEYAQRTVGMYPEMKELGGRLYISGAARNINDIILETTSKKLDFVGIDFVDWLVKEASESAYAQVYMRCVEMARLLKIPVVLLAQPNREGLKMKRFINKFDLRYTGMAENSAWMLIGLQKTNSIDMDDDRYITMDDDHEYLLFLALRGEWKKQIGPGAIILECGQGIPKWSGKPYMGKMKLWTPGGNGNKIGAKKSTKRSDE